MKSNINKELYPNYPPAPSTLPSVVQGSFCTHLQLQRQGDPLRSPVEPPGTLAQAVESRDLVLGAQARPGHQGASAQEDVVAAPTQGIGISKDERGGGAARGAEAESSVQTRHHL